MSKIAIIGAGPAGIETATVLARQHDVLLFEKENAPLCNIRNKALLFPDFTSADELANNMMRQLEHPRITTYCDTDITDLRKAQNSWQLTDAKGNQYEADYVVLSTGYQIFDAHKKEELGYGIYPGIITSIDLEKMIKEGKITNSIGDAPKSVTFLQCVGSRDEKSGNHYCSKVCCVTAVKQAIEVRKMLPNTTAYVFYMDLRMWGQGFEEMYRTAQEQYGVNFVRGRISEAAATYDQRVQLKAEDTLMGLPLNMTTDLLVLMVGMCASEGTDRLAHAAGIAGKYNFAQSVSEHLKDNLTEQEGLFLAGSCKRPMSIQDTIQDARAAAITILEQIA
ncbi:MAG: CoB--CoM heterodisulfide reductase iron-sulfur subunit A family protein [Bacteroidales bacterium]|nr:CoB--CoM heterodisulfide reductase iron-sulfur subunit A family protein [Bacteroidales bacterium]